MIYNHSSSNSLFQVFRRQRAKAQSRTTIRPKLPSIRDDSAWLKRLYSSTDASSICSSLYFLNQGQILILLDHHCKWITKSLNIRQAHVLFGLFAALDTLLTGDEISIVRRVAKRLNAIRKRRSAEKDDEEFIWLDILIAIVVNDYGQLDLWQI